MDKGVKKKYNRIKLIISLVGLGIELLFWILIISLGISHELAKIAYQTFTSNLLQFYLFVFILGILHLLLNLPLSTYSGFIVEHRFSLSNQNFIQWITEQVKGLLVGTLLGIIILTLFYILLWKQPNYWWWQLWIFILLFSILLSHLAPALIFPLFYKFKPLDRPELKKNLEEFAKKWRLKITEIFEFNLSKTTKKANAAFTGIGRSKRVLLADTLLENFSEEEIETIFAHEVGHFVKRHLIKGILFNSLLTLAGLYIVYRIYEIILLSKNLVAHQLEALPYLALIFFFYSLITGPLSNILSRRFEYQADDFAVKTTQKLDFYKNSLNRLADLNLVDEAPHPLVEFLFHSHPSINNRIDKISQV